MSKVVVWRTFHATDPWLSDFTAAAHIEKALINNMKVAVIGHLEWTRIAYVNRLPASGDIVHADLTWEGPAGGGAVAAVQLMKLAGSCTFFTALGDDSTGRNARAALESIGVEVIPAIREAPTREAFALIESGGERTTTTLGARLQPLYCDALPWDRLGEYDAIYFSAGNAPLLRSARSSATLVVSAREMATAVAAEIFLDAVVGSSRDPEESYDPDSLKVPPTVSIATDGAHGGRYAIRGGPWLPYAPETLPGPAVDCYGAGDSFAAAFTFGLARFNEFPAAVTLAARCGAACIAGSGPFSRQYCRDDLELADLFT